MNDNPIIIESDLEENASSSSRRRVEPSLHSLPYVRRDFETKIASPIWDSETEKECLGSSFLREHY